MRGLAEAAGETVRSVEELQRFDRNMFSAEYGQGSTIVGLLGKTGGNEFHSTEFEFAPNDSFDAASSSTTSSASEGSVLPEPVRSGGRRSNRDESRVSRRSATGGSSSSMPCRW